MPDSLPDAAPPVRLRHVVWPLLLSLAVLVGVGYVTDFSFSELRRIPALLNPWLLGAAIGMTVAQVIFGGWRLYYLSHARLGFATSIRAQLAWHFFSNVTPTAVGGGPVTALYIARDRDVDVTVGEATAFMLFTMLMDQLWFIIAIPVLLVATLFFDLIPPSLGMVGTWAFAACFAILLVWSFLFAYAVLFRPDLLQRLADRLFRWHPLRRFRTRVMREMSQLGRRARTLSAQPLSFYVNGLLLTIGMWTARYLVVVFIVWCVCPAFDKLLAFLRTAAMMLAALLMPTPGAAGGLEGLYALFIGPLLQDTALVAPTLLTWRVLAYYLFIALGVYLSVHHAHQTIQYEKNRGGGASEAPPVRHAPADATE